MFAFWNILVSKIGILFVIEPIDEQETLKHVFQNVDDGLFLKVFSYVFFPMFLACCAIWKTFHPCQERSSRNLEKHVHHKMDLFSYAVVHVFVIKVSIM